MPKKKKPVSSQFHPFALLPIIFLAVIFLIRIVFFDIYRELVSEDGILETLQFVFYFLSGAVLLQKLLAIYKTSGHWIVKCALLLLAGGLMFISFEEISWGERILNYGRPDYFTVYNVQQEFSVHNLVYIQPLIHSTYIILGLGLGLIVPLLSKISLFKKFRQYMFGWDLSLYFIPLSVVYFLLVIAEPVSLYGFSKYGLIWRDQEVVETLLGMGFFVWALKYNRSSTI